jgi:hypothetical protein
MGRKEGFSKYPVKVASGFSAGRVAAFIRQWNSNHRTAARQAVRQDFSALVRISGDLPEFPPEGVSNVKR